MKKVFLIFFLGFLALIAATPTLASTSYGKNLLERFCARSGYAISCKKLSLSWLGPQRLEGVVLESADKTLQVSCEKAECLAPLWKVIFSYDKCKVHIEEGTGAFTLHKDNFSYLNPVQPANVVLSISQLTLPLNRWQDASFTLEGELDKLVLLTAGKPLKLQNLELKARKESAASPLFFEIVSDIGAPDGTYGKVSCIASFPELSSIDYPLTCSATLDVVKMPSQLLGTSLTPFFGGSIDAHAKIDLTRGSGPVEIHLQSPYTRLSASGDMRENVLFLKEPAHLQCLMTEALSDALLQETNPFSLSSLISSHPLTLQIDKDGFSLPLHDWKTLSLTHARLELGEIKTQHAGLLKPLSLWFAPIDFSIEKGTVKVERTEIFVNQKFEVATWGKLNLPDASIDMVLGLSSQSFGEAFQIQNLPASFVVQIPMKGKMKSIKLDGTAISAKAFALQALEQGVRGHEGTVPPAKRPLPWEKSKTYKREHKQEKSFKKKNKIKKEDKPLKQVLKILR